jgi:D-alanyl-D-alanine carboxypeptidase (penicillin-binding protein 5/6)
VSRPRRLLTALAACVAAALAVLPASGLAAPVPQIDVRASALIDANTGQQLYGKNAKAELPIASTTKLMTALVTLEHARLDRTLSAPAYQLSAADSQIGLMEGDRMTVHDLVIAMMLPSADDAAEDLAYNIGGRSVARFVAMMNAEAARLGLRHTHYTTPVGLDTPGNHSTAADLVALAQYVLRTQPFFRHVVDLPSAVIRIGDDPRRVANLNSLVGRVPWVTGVKTGHTLGAGYVLVGSGTRGGMTLISAVLGATSESARESDTLAMLDWGFHNFTLVTPVAAGTVVVRRPVKGRHGLRAALVASGGFSRVFPRSTRVRTVVRAARQLTGPLRKGAVVGRVVVLAGGVPVTSIPLRLGRAVPAPPSSLTATAILGPFTLVVLVLLLVAVIIRARRGRPAARRAAGEPTHDHHRHAQSGARQDAGGS